MVQSADTNLPIFLSNCEHNVESLSLIIEISFSKELDGLKLQPDIIPCPGEGTHSSNSNILVTNFSKDILLIAA